MNTRVKGWSILIVGVLLLCIVGIFVWSEISAPIEKPPEQGQVTPVKTPLPPPVAIGLPTYQAIPKGYSYQLMVLDLSWQYAMTGTLEFGGACPYNGIVMNMPRGGFLFSVGDGNATDKIDQMVKALVPQPFTYTVVLSDSVATAWTDSFYRPPCQ